MAARFSVVLANSLVRTTALPDYNATYTMMGWFYRISDRDDFGTLFYFGLDSAAEYDWFNVGSDGTTLSCWTTGGSNTTGSTLAATTWTHIAGVRESATSMKMYVNGVLDITHVTNVGTSRTAPERLSIGNYVGNYQLDGRAAGIKLFDAALTMAEIQQEMNLLRPSRFANINGWYPVWPGSPERARDYSGLGHDWTESGTQSDEDPPPVSYGAPVWTILYPVAAGGNVTVTPGAVALSLAAPAPTVAHAALPGAVALSLTEPAVTPSLAALPSSVALSLAAPAPTPVRSVLPGAVALNLSALSPTPVLQATPGAVALALNTLAATPGIRANPNAIALLLNVLAPTIQSGSSVTVTPSTVALALNVLSPTPAFQVAPSAVALTLAALTATPGVSATPGVMALILAALAPTVTGPGGVTVTPAAVALTMQALAASPGIQVTPAAVALILAVLNPSFGVPHGLATAVTVRIIGPSATTERT